MGDTKPVRRSPTTSSGGGGDALFDVAVFFTLVGFAFKVSAVPFHFWAPDTYEGAPTPVTAFLSVASKAGGFVAMLSLIYVGFFGRTDVLAADPVGAGRGVDDGREPDRHPPDQHRADAGLLVHRPGRVHARALRRGQRRRRSPTTSAFEGTVVYLLIYSAMNLGAFAVVIAVARKTRSGEIESYAGLFHYAPGLCLAMSAFLFSLAGIPPLAGWYAKLVVFNAVLDAGNTQAVILGVSPPSTR